MEHNPLINFKYRSIISTTVQVKKRFRLKNFFFHFTHYNLARNNLRYIVVMFTIREPGINFCLDVHSKTIQAGMMSPGNRCLPA